MSFTARLDYGISLKSLIPTLSSEDVEEIAGEIRESVKKVQEILDENSFISVLKFVFIGNSIEENDDSDIIFCCNNELSVIQDSSKLVKLIDTDEEILNIKKASFQYECFLLLKELGYEQEYQIQPGWILSLEES